jgi:hypothetical protein
MSPDTQVFAVASPGAEVRVTKLPGKGELRQVAPAGTHPGAGEAIRTVGTAVTHPNGLLIYSPVPNANGAPLDTFALAAYHPVSGAYSKDSLIPVTVRPDYALSLASRSGVESSLLAPLSALAPALRGGAFTLEMYLKSTFPGGGLNRFFDFDTGGGVYNVPDFGPAASAHAATLAASPSPSPAVTPAADQTADVDGTNVMTGPLPSAGSSLGDLVVAAVDVQGPPLNYPQLALPLAAIPPSRWYHIAATFDG